MVAFTKVSLEPGEAHEVTMAVDPDAAHHPMSVWDAGAHAFVVPSGDYTIYLGTSSDDTPLQATLTVA